MSVASISHHLTKDAHNLGRLLAEASSCSAGRILILKQVLAVVSYWYGPQGNAEARGLGHRPADAANRGCRSRLAVQHCLRLEDPAFSNICDVPAIAYLR